MAVRTQRIKRKVAREVKRIQTPEEAAEVIEEIRAQVEQRVAEQPKGKVPGMTIGGSKVTYTYQDLEGMFPIVSFIPEETIPLTFQGVKVQAFEGIEMHVPECFKRIYDNHRREARLAFKDSLRDGSLIELGMGVLPPE